MKLAISFTNFGPYHLARLRALAAGLARAGDALLAIETAGAEQRYPWLPAPKAEPFSWETLFPGHALETIPRGACVRALRATLDRERPDAVAIAGYARPESVAALGWARRNRRPVILMSESQAIDHPRTWWKEAIKRSRLRGVAAALVGGPRHRDYLASLGVPAGRISLGYNAVDNGHFARLADEARRAPESRDGLPDRPYFLAVGRFVREKNLPRLVRAFASYRAGVTGGEGWDLVLCGDGPGAAEVESAILASGMERAIHRPGFLQADELPRWYANASAFVHPSLMEPWGLVVNEAAASGSPLLVSDRAGCVETLVPDPVGATGMRFDPANPSQITSALRWMAGLPEARRVAMGRHAAEVVASWGPERFALGMFEALALATSPRAKAAGRREVARPKLANLARGGMIR